MPEHYIERRRGRGRGRRRRSQRKRREEEGKEEAKARGGGGVGSPTSQYKMRCIFIKVPHDLRLFLMLN